MGSPGPIPWTAIDQYAERVKITEDELLYDDLVFYIRKMDETYLRISQEEQERQSAASKNSRPDTGKGKSEW